ncbi:MAG: hypothetical protein ACRD30_04885 [Bryobacteraceae bacterium]
MKLTSEPSPPGQPPRFPWIGVVCMIGGGVFLYKAGFGFGIVLMALGAAWLIVALAIKFRSKRQAKLKT